MDHCLGIAVALLVTALFAGSLVLTSTPTYALYEELEGLAEAPDTPSEGNDIQQQLANLKDALGKVKDNMTDLEDRLYEETGRLSEEVNRGEDKSRDVMTDLDDDINGKVDALRDAIQKNGDDIRDLIIDNITVGTDAFANWRTSNGGEAANDTTSEPSDSNDIQRKISDLKTALGVAKGSLSGIQDRLYQKADALAEGIQKNEADIKELRENQDDNLIANARHPNAIDGWRNFKAGTASESTAASTEIPSGVDSDVHQQIADLKSGLGAVRNDMSVLENSLYEKTDAIREAIRKNEAEIKELEANLTRVEHARHPVNTADWLNFSGFQWIGEISMGEETTTSVPSDKPSGRKADVHRQIDQLRHQMGIVKQGLYYMEKRFTDKINFLRKMEMKNALTN